MKNEFGPEYASIADEGRRMWLAFPSLFDFSELATFPEKFRPTCHIFYSSRVMDMEDKLPKWSGHKNHSVRLQMRVISILVAPAH